MSEIEEEIRRQIVAEREAAAISPESAAALDEGWGVPASAPEPPPTPPHPPTSQRKGKLGALGAVGVFIGKFWAVILTGLSKLKFLLVVFKLAPLAKVLLAAGTMLISMWAWSTRFGWPFAVGFVLLIVIHECGHALAARRLGHPTGFMVFIPFCGGLVSTRASRNVVEGAFIGIMGPVAGALACLGCCLLFLVTRSPYWMALAWVGFFMNLLNLAPSPPLDGGWLLPLFSPKLLLPCLAIGVFLFRHNPMIWVLIALSLPRILYAWKHGNTSAYYQASAIHRWRFGLAWAALAALLAVGMALAPIALAMNRVMM